MEQQCPQLQALAMNLDFPLCLTALTSLTCQEWLTKDIDSFRCSRLGHLHVLYTAKLKLLPSTLSSLSLESIRGVFVGNIEDQHLRSQRCLMHICFTTLLCDLPMTSGAKSGPGFS